MAMGVSVSFVLLLHLSFYRFYDRVWSDTSQLRPLSFGCSKRTLDSEPCLSKPCVLAVLHAFAATCPLSLVRL